MIELKVLYKSLERTLADELEQTWEYLDRCGAGFLRSGECKADDCVVT